MEEQWLTMQEVREFLKTQTGFMPLAASLYDAARRHIRTKTEVHSAKAYRNKPKTILFLQEDVQCYADIFNAKRQGLLSLEEAYALAKNRLTIEDFVSLVEKHNMPPIAAHMWQFNFFRQEDITAFLALSEEKLHYLLKSKERPLSISEAVAYLNDKFSKQGFDVKIKANTLSAKVKHGMLLPATRPPEGARTGYTFHKESLDALTFRGYHAVQKDTVNVVEINDSTTMASLEKQHGTLVSTERAIEILEEKAGRRYNHTGAQMRLRYHVAPVARSGHLLYYPEHKVKRLKARVLQNGNRPIAQGE